MYAIVVAVLAGLPYKHLKRGAKMKEINRGLSLCLGVVIVAILSSNAWGLSNGQVVRAAPPGQLHAASAADGTMTTLLSEGFEDSFPPPGWFTEAVTGNTGLWASSTQTVHPSGAAPYEGGTLAYFNSYDAHAGDAARLYTDPLDLSAPGYYYLSFWMHHDLAYNTLSDTLVVEVDDGYGWVELGNVVYRYDGTQGWAQHTIDISAYSGKNVRVSLKGVSGYGNDINIDDVTVYSQSSPNPTATPTQTLTSSPTITQTPTLTATPTNTGTPTATPHPCAIPGAPATLAIPAGDVSALIQAITIANARCGDTIELAAGSIYSLTSLDNYNNGPNGLPSITSQVTINGNGATITRSAAAGTPTFRIFDIASSADLRLITLTIENGRSLGAVGADAKGGAIYKCRDVVSE
jgi:hypothetical protein